MPTTTPTAGSYSFRSTARRSMCRWRFTLRGTQRFFDQQGAVHARVSVDFAREFGCLLEAEVK